MTDGDAIAARLTELQRLFERRLLEDRTKNDLIASVQQSLAARDALSSGEAFGELILECLLAIDRLRAQRPSAELSESIAEELLEVFARRGLERLPDEGDFDPRMHEAVGTAPVTPAMPAGRIAEVQRHGYALAGRVLRPARVVVATDAAEA